MLCIHKIQIKNKYLNKSNNYISHICFIIRKECVVLFVTHTKWKTKSKSKEQIQDDKNLMYTYSSNMLYFNVV